MTSRETTSARVAVIVLTTLGCLALAVWSVASPRFFKEGARLYAYRNFLMSPVRRRFPKRPLVVWMGDSTIAKSGKKRQYPTLVERGLEGVHAIESFNRSFPGADAYVHYSTMGRVLELDPAAVFIVANLRIMKPVALGIGVLQFASLIPREELPRTALLPWYGRGTTFPRVLLARALDWKLVDSGAYVIQGAREVFHDAVWTTRPRRRARWPYENIMNAIQALGEPISSSSPMVQMLAASVRMAASHGVPVTVVVAPVLGENLEQRFGDRFGERFAMLRSVVERAGGELVDLHDLLTKYEFHDLSGHYTPGGAAHIADVLSPIVRRRVAEGTRPRHE